MQTDRYNGHRRGGLDVNGMALALGATAALLFGLTLTAPHFTKAEDPPLVIESIPADPPPPLPPEPKPKPQPELRHLDPMPAARPDPVDVTRPPVAPPVGADLAPATETLPNPGTTVGTGLGGTIPQPVHVPVERGARLDSRYADTFQPDYPMGERTAERAGRVVVRVLIGTDGRVKTVEQVSAPNAAFFEATRKRALAKWRFVPATRDGVAIETWQQIGVLFQLDTE